MNTLIQEIKEYALLNYEYGYDVLIECWDDSEYARWINHYEVTSLNEFIQSYAFMLDYRDEIKATAF